MDLFGAWSTGAQEPWPLCHSHLRHEVFLPGPGSVLHFFLGPWPQGWKAVREGRVPFFFLLFFGGGRSWTAEGEDPPHPGRKAARPQGHKAARPQGKRVSCRCCPSIRIGSPQVPNKGSAVLCSALGERGVRRMSAYSQSV